MIMYSYDDSDLNPAVTLNIRTEQMYLVFPCNKTRATWKKLTSAPNVSSTQLSVLLFAAGCVVTMSGTPHEK